MLNYCDTVGPSIITGANSDDSKNMNNFLYIPSTVWLNPFRRMVSEWPSAVTLLLALGLAIGEADTNFLTGANDILAVR